MKKKKLPSYDFGGLLNNIKDLGLNYLKTSPDVLLTTLGMGNVISDDSYKGMGSEFASKYSSTLGGIQAAVAPAILNMAVPGAGTALSGVQQVGSQFNPQQDSANPYINPMQRNTNPYGMQHGGYLNQQGPNTQEVVGHRPNQTDGVELQNAYVDDGETISNTSNGQYVFSDKLINPLTNKTFAEDDKKIAMSDKEAWKKYYDAEAKNTLEMNQKQREKLVQLNEGMKTLFDVSENIKGLAKGGWMKPRYQNGGPLYQKGYSAPWEDFNIGEFQTYAGLSPDNIYGPKTHGALLGDVGKQYAAQMGYVYDDMYQTNGTSPYISASGRSSFTPDYGISGVPNVPDLLNLKQGISGRLGTNIPQVGSAYQVGGGQIGNPSMMNPYSNTETTYKGEGEFGALPLQRVSDGTLDNTIKSRTSPYVDPYSSVVNPDTKIFDDKLGTEENSSKIWDWTKNNPGTILQALGLVGKGFQVAKKPERQALYQNNAPISLQQYDASPALNRSQYSFNALKNSLANSVGDAARTGNLQQAYSNKTMNEADIISRYADMNKQAQRDYETRLGQRKGENIQYRYNTDTINSQNKGARNTAISQFLTDIQSLGGEMNKQKDNQQAIQWLLQAYPDIANLLKLK